MRYTGFVFLAALMAIPCGDSVAQWIGTDELPIEPEREQIYHLGSDVSKSTVPGGPVAVVSVYGEGHPAPPVYPAKPEYIDALKLDTAQIAALKKEFPGFTPWTLEDYSGSAKYFPFSKKQMPYAIDWNFDGRSAPIKIIAGRIISDVEEDEKNYVLVFKPKGKGYKIIRHETGFSYPTRFSTRRISLLRMIRRGSIVRIHDEFYPATYVLPHDAYVHFEVRASTRSPNEYPQLDGDNSIYYFHEGLSKIERTGIKDLHAVLKPDAGKAMENIVLPQEIIKALVGFNKDFKVWDARDYSSPADARYAIKYDFNGDGKDDMIVAGHDNNANLVLEVISGPDGYHVHPVGQSNSCYERARSERNVVLPFKPSHSLSLYTKGRNYAGLTPESVQRLWKHNDEVLVGIRMLNTCLKEKEPQEEFGFLFEHTDWLPWTSLSGEERETFYVYAETHDSIYCPGGSDACGYELSPPSGAQGGK